MNVDGLVRVGVGEVEYFAKNRDGLREQRATVFAREGERPREIFVVGLACRRFGVEPGEPGPFVRRARVVRRDGRAEAPRARMNEEPEHALRIAIELEEVVSASERAEVTAREGLAGTLERARGERRFE